MVERRADANRVQVNQVEVRRPPGCPVDEDVGGMQIRMDYARCVQPGNEPRQVQCQSLANAGPLRRRRSGNGAFEKAPQRHCSFEGLRDQKALPGTPAPTNTPSERTNCGNTESCQGAGLLKLQLRLWRPQALAQERTRATNSTMLAIDRAVIEVDAPNRAVRAVLDLFETALSAKLAEFELARVQQAGSVGSQRPGNAIDPTGR